MEKRIIEKHLNQLKIGDRVGHLSISARALRDIAEKIEIHEGDEILEAVPELEKKLMHENENLRHVCAGALVPFGLNGHYVLNKLLNHEDFNVRKGAVNTLSRILKNIETNPEE